MATRIPFRLSLLNSVQFSACAQKQRLARYRRRGHETVAELVFRQLLEFPLRGNDSCFPFFAKEIEAALSRERSGGIISADAFVPKGMARFCFPTSRHAVVINAKKQVANEQQRRFLGHVAFGSPSDLQLSGRRLRGVHIQHLALLAGANRKELAGGESAGHKYQSMADQWASSAGMRGALFNAPEFLARQRIVRVERLSTLAQQRGPPIQRGDLARGEALPKISFGLHAPIRVEVFVID